MAKLFNQVSRDAQTALTEFSSEFDSVFTAPDADPWAERCGLVNTSTAIRTTYPIPIDAAGYKVRKGDDRMRRLMERSLSMSPIEWVDGVQELASVVEAPDFIGWGGAPSRMATEASRLPNVLVAALLAANPYLDLYRVEKPGGSVASTIHLFDTTHPVNIFDAGKGVFTNVGTAAKIGVDFTKAAKIRFRKRKAPNGKAGGYRFTHLLVPSALEEEAREFYESDNIILAVTNKAGSENVGGVPTNNRHKGTVEVIVCDELEEDNVVYPMDVRKGAYPWIIQNGGGPEEIPYTKLDGLYKDKGMIGVKYVLKMAVAAALPHAIERITIG